MYKERSIAGLDTETINGRPYTIQIYSEGEGRIHFVNAGNITEVFLNCLLTLPNKTALYAHNLEFDLPILFFPFLEHFQMQTQFELESNEFRVRILCGKVNHADITIGDQSYELIDSLAFFQTSLANAAKTFNLPFKKKKPRRLGEVRYKGMELQEFKKYAINDAIVVQMLGEKIAKYHEKENVALTLSAPQLSSKVFRANYIKDSDTIPALPMDADEASVLSYHGGKNGMYVAPGVYRNVKVYDINSAYPYAFTQIPNFLNCKYEYVTKRESGIGVYCCNGFASNSPYNLLRNHNFEPIYGPFENLWFTSYEIQCALRHGFVKNLEIIEGYVVRENSKATYNPLTDFANEYYYRKQSERGELREFYKIMLNSLYGKFIQHIANEDLTKLTMNEDDGINLSAASFQAGGLWNPLLGSLITGFVRSYLTNYEVQYKGLHSSTDSIISTRWLHTGLRLGEWGIKTKGSALLIRSKLYVVWNDDREITAFALHGFHGSLQTLLHLVRTGKRKYYHRRMIKLKESYRQKKTPFIMEGMTKQLNIDLPAIEIPPLKMKIKGNWRWI